MNSGTLGSVKLNHVGVAALFASLGLTLAASGCDAPSSAPAAHVAAPHSPAWEAAYGEPMDECAAAVGPSMSGLEVGDHFEFERSKLERELEILGVEFEPSACNDWANALIAHGPSREPLDDASARTVEWPTVQERQEHAKQFDRALVGLQVAHLDDESRLIEALFAGAEASLAFGHTFTPHWRYAASERWVKTLDGWLCRDRTLLERFESRRDRLVQQLPSASHRWQVTLAALRRDDGIRQSSPERVAVTPVIDRMAKLSCDDWQSCNDGLTAISEDLQRTIDPSLRSKRLPFIPDGKDQEARAAQRTIQAAEDAHRMMDTEWLLARSVEQRGYFAGCKKK